MNKFESEVLAEERSQVFGSSLINMIQNNSMPNLDLIVREATQNSLDASLPSSKKTIVKYKYNSFDKKSLADFYPEEDIDISNFYPDEKYNFISISDYNTCGLIGNLDGKLGKDQSNQNLGKLVFHIMRAQDQAGAGGSWGIGKTVYYRLGPGLVIYYSRIKKDNGEYEERLVSSIAENEKLENTLLKDEENIGIAYFGKKKDDNSKKVQAITDREFISKLLSIFNIEQYKNDETGTTIIIPFVDDAKMKMNTTSAEAETEHDSYWWQNSVQDYLKMALLRWYFPRMTESYKYGARLVAYVNDEKVEPDLDSYYFGKMMELYSYAYKTQNIPEWITKKEITRKNNVKQESLGTLLYGIIDREEFGDGPKPQNFALIRSESDEDNRPLICFCRKPGMIVNYINQGHVVGNISKEPNKFIIGIFVLNSNNTLTYSGSEKNLDEYVRGSEESDHTSWNDYQIEGFNSKLLIVSNIFNSIAKELGETYGTIPKITGKESICRSLSSKFGKLLLPEVGFGTNPSGRKHSGGGGGGERTVKTKKVDYKFNGKSFSEDSIDLKYKFNIKKQVKKIRVLTQINTVGKKYLPDVVEKEGMKIPFCINKLSLRCLSSNRVSGSKNSVVCETTVTGKKFMDFDIEFIKTPMGIVYGFELINTNNSNKTFEFETNIDLHFGLNKLYQANIIVEVE